MNSLIANGLFKINRERGFKNNNNVHLAVKLFVVITMVVFLCKLLKNMSGRNIENFENLKEMNTYN